MAVSTVSPSLASTLAAEWSLHWHNRRNKQGIVDTDAQNFYLIHNALPSDIFQQALTDAGRLKADCVRTETHWRRGSAIGGHELKALCESDRQKDRQSDGCNWLGYLESDEFLSKVQRVTGLDTMQYVPEEDTNRLSLLLYEGVDGGDGIDWHVDGSIYLGQRWAGILILIEDTFETTAKLELEPNGVITSLPRSEMTNTLVLFRGDHVRHRVRAMQKGEERVVLSLLFSDWPQRTRNPFLRRYQSRVNQAFYNNPAP